MTDAMMYRSGRLLYVYKWVRYVKIKPPVNSYFSFCAHACTFCDDLRHFLVTKKAFGNQNSGACYLSWLVLLRLIALKIYKLQIDMSTRAFAGGIQSHALSFCQVVGINFAFGFGGLT
jgi:hypothetical protein